MSRFVTQSLSPKLTFRQRWNHYLLLLVAVVCLTIAVFLRDSSLSAVSTYVNATAGFSAKYPRNWLLDTTGDYVFRVQDISSIGFKTTIQVSVQTISASTSTRNIVDSLTLNRSQLLAAYRALPTNNKYILPDGTIAAAVNYTYAAINPDPFLETVPIVVKGIDIFSMKRGQVVIISFISDSNSFDDDYATFDRFLSELKF